MVCLVEVCLFDHNLRLDLSRLFVCQSDHKISSDLGYGAPEESYGDLKFQGLIEAMVVFYSWHQ